MLVYAESGDNFVHSVKKIKEQIKSDEDYLDLEFNGIRVRVSKDSSIHDLATIYDLKCEVRRLDGIYQKGRI